jgi:hypothetical protein
MSDGTPTARSTAAAEDQAVVDAYNSSMGKTRSVFGAMSAAEAVFRRQQRPAQDRAGIASAVALIVSRATLTAGRGEGGRKR